MSKEELLQKLLDTKELLEGIIRRVEEGYEETLPEPKFEIGKSVYATHPKAVVTIEDRFWNNETRQWCYKFHGPSALMTWDYYSSYPEDGLQELSRK